MRFKFNPKVFFTLLSALIILAGTILAINYAKGGYRVTDSGFARGTGLLAANSFPPGAEVYINGKLTTATDDTLYLDPGDYEIEILKDGFSPWKKSVKIQQELVTQTNANLFPSSPSLTALTYTGIQNIVPSPDGQKVLYYTASASAAAKNGLYILELANNPLNFQSGSMQIAEDVPELNLANASFIWSPDSSEILLMTENREVILQIDTLNKINQLTDVGLRRKQILAEWEEEMYVREREYLLKFPLEISKIATESAENVYISPDKKRLLYTATESAVIPEGLIPPLPSTNSHPQERSIEPLGIYVYDREEDTNYRVGTTKPIVNETSKSLLATDLYSQRPVLLNNASPSAFTSLQATNSATTALKYNLYHTSLYANTLQWFPDSRHLLYIQENTINVMSYDGTNKTVLYAGPFKDNFFYPWPDGSRLLISTVFGIDAPANLYAIELK